MARIVGWGLVALALGVAGCFDGEEAEDSGSTEVVGECAAGDVDGMLSNDIACADLAAFAWSQDGTTLLEVTVATGLLADAFAAGGTQTLTFELPDVAVDVKLKTGTCLDELACNDALACAEHPVDVERLPTSGTLTIALVDVVENTECCSDYLGTATFMLCDVVFEATGHADETVGNFSWTSGVGWLPG